MDTPDASSPPQPQPDAAVGPAPQMLSVSGVVHDYWTGDPLSEAALTTDGIAPPLTARSTADGAYVFDNVPVGSKLYIDSTRSNYRPTHSEEVTVADQSLEQALYMVSLADVQRQHGNVSAPGQLIEVAPGTAFVVVELLRNNGAPLIDVPAADITLVDGQALPVGVGPFFFGEQGELVTLDLVAQSTAFNGRARAAFLNVPPGANMLTVSYAAGGGAIQQFVVPVLTAADGATLARTGGQGGENMPPPPDPNQVSFTEDVFPLLQRASQGGQACANCHTATGVAAFLPFDMPAAETHALLLAQPGVINLAVPAESLLLTKPLYELEGLQNHPNATWLTVEDPAYLIVLGWITGGALL